jgi:hypothetical protein
MLTCPSDHEDRFYGDPYSPTNQTTYAGGIPLRPVSCGQDRDVITYNISYAFATGLIESHEQPFALWADETNGPDVNALAWYGDGSTPIGGTTLNSTAAGAAAVGSYAKVDNHGVAGGNVAYSDGSGRFNKGGSLGYRGGGGVID